MHGAQAVALADEHLGVAARGLDEELLPGGGVVRGELGPAATEACRGRRHLAEVEFGVDPRSAIAGARPRTPQPAPRGRGENAAERDATRDGATRLDDDEKPPTRRGALDARDGVADDPGTTEDDVGATDIVTFGETSR